MSECEKCHGTGEITCSACNGQKTETCKRCGGSGKVLCNRCSGNGEITCRECRGSGTVTKWKECSVCDHGKVGKTQWINCGHCHGTGTITIEGRRGYYEQTCYDCRGRGQVKEEYTEICPNCNGEYRKPVEKQCSECYGRGYIPCETKCGEHRKVLKCRDCDGTGRTECSHCGGTGTEKCPDCERREKERKAREAEQKKKEEQRRAEEERKKGEAKKRKAQEEYRLRCEKEQARQRAKRRVSIILGILWRFVFAVGAGFLFWWWLEGFNKEALFEMLEQVKGSRGGGISENFRWAMIVSGGAFVALYLLTFILSKVSISFEGVVQVLSSLIACVPAVVLISSGHWGIGGWMALVIVCAISAKFEGKAHDSWWRWILMSIGLWVSGGFGMNGNWIISSVITAFSMGILLKGEK